MLYCSSAALPRPDGHGNLSPPDRSDRSRGRGGADHAGRDGGVGPARSGRAHGRAARAAASTARSAAASSNTRRSRKRARRSPPGAGRRAAARSRSGRSSASAAAGASSGGSRPSTGATSPSSRRCGAAEREGPFVALARLGADGRVARRLGDAAEDGDRREAFGEATTPVYLFGAGHVGRALALALAPLPFAVRWIDPRPDEFPKLAPANVTLVAAADPPAELTAAPDGAFVLAITHSHPLDLAVVAEALRQDRFAYVGMIGSATKRARFVSQLRAAGIRRSARRQARLPDRRAGDRRQGAGGDRRRRRRAIADGARGVAERADLDSDRRAAVRPTSPEPSSAQPADSKMRRRRSAMRRAIGKPA